MSNQTLPSESLSYDDILLMPQYSDIRSRTEVSTTTDLGNGLKLRLPVLASPMDTISETAMAIAIGTEGGAAIIHRYNGIEIQSRMVAMAKDVAASKYNNDINIGAAVGISGDFIERAKTLIESGATFLCVDVAHGHHILMKEAIEKLRHALGPDIHLMAGNVATLEGINDLSDWGADSVRCNIGGGSICSTRVQTGHGVPGLQTILDCAKTDRKVTIIADGGIKNSGDIVKALAAGASFAMLGSLLSGTEQSPGEKIYSDGSIFKEYRGMASSRAQMKWRGRVNSREGVAALVPFKGDVNDIIDELEAGIKSGLSYTGARTIEEFQVKAEIVQQTGSGKSESGTHIFNLGNTSAGGFE